MPLHWILALLLGIPPLPITFLVTAPASTAPADTLYLTGDQPALGRWDPAGVPLRRMEDGIYEATVRMPPGTAIRFKITRGSWATVETDERGEKISDRRYVVSVVDTVHVGVAAWREREAAPGPEKCRPPGHRGHCRPRGDARIPPGRGGCGRCDRSI